MKGYITLKEASVKWGLSARWINEICAKNRIPGAEQVGRVWIIPEDAEKPTKDNRVKTGAYRDWRKKYGKNKIQERKNDIEV